MSKRSRRKGVRYIEEDRDRAITLNKRREGLFKLANDLSILTDANVAICLHDNNKVQFFGAPSVEPIANAFLSDPQTEPFADKQLKAKITSMQSELIQLESEEKEKGKKTEESIQRFKEVQEESLGMAKHLFSRAEDLSHDNIQELLQVLSLLQRDVKQRLPTIRRDSKLQVSGPSAWARPQPSSPRFIASHRPSTPLLPGGASGIPMIPPPPPVLGTPWSHIQGIPMIPPPPLARGSPWSRIPEIPMICLPLVPGSPWSRIPEIPMIPPSPAPGSTWSRTPEIPMISLPPVLASPWSHTPEIPMIPPPPAPGSPWSHIFPLRPPQFRFPSLVPSQQLPPVSPPRNTVSPPPMHAPLAQQPLTNQSSAIPLLTQWQMRFGAPPPSEVQAYTPVEQPQNDSTAPAPAQTFSDNFLSVLLADISDDGISPVDPLGSPLIDNQLNGTN